MESSFVKHCTGICADPFKAEFFYTLLCQLPKKKKLNTSGLPSVCLLLFGCLYVPGGGLEPFRRVLHSDGLLPFCLSIGEANSQKVKPA